MTVIDPSAFVSPDATLADNVWVGPGAIIEAGAVVGAGSRILARAILTGHVSLGENNEVGYGAVLGADPQVLGFKKEIQSSLVIGNGNIFREYVTIHRGMSEGSRTSIGDENFLMVGVHVGHNATLAHHVVIANNCLLAGHVEVEERAVLGGGAVFHQHIRVGKLAMVRGGSRISKNIPPYLTAYESDLVAGLNSVGLRRSGMMPSLRAELKEAFRCIYRSGLNVTEALQAAQLRTWSQEAGYFFQFIAQAGSRGICRLKLKASEE